jgi:hypothetical protein
MARPVGAFNRESFSPLLDAARELATPERAPTRREIADAPDAEHARDPDADDNLRRTGRLLPVRLRHVPHRTRPVAEYAPADAVAQAAEPAAESPGWAELQRALAAVLR